MTDSLSLYQLQNYAITTISNIYIRCHDSTTICTLTTIPQPDASINVSISTFVITSSSFRNIDPFIERDPAAFG